MRSDHTNMAVHFGLRWHISIPMIQLKLRRDRTTPVWFRLVYMGHGVMHHYLAVLPSQAGNLTVIKASLQNSTEALSNSHFRVILFLLSHVLILTWAINHLFLQLNGVLNLQYGTNHLLPHFNILIFLALYCKYIRLLPVNI